MRPGISIKVSSAGAKPSTKIELLSRKRMDAEKVTSEVEP
jgi:hypothetical protein